LIQREDYGWKSLLLWLFSMLFLLQRQSLTFMSGGASLLALKEINLRKILLKGSKKLTLGDNWFFLWIIYLVYLGRLLLLFFPDLIFLNGDEAIVSHNAQVAFQEGLDKNRWEFLGAKAGTLNYFPALWYYLQGLIIKVLGPGVASIKFFSLFTDIGILLLIYSLAKEWFDKDVAKATALVYSTLPISVHFGMTGYQNIQSTFFLMAMLLVLSKTRRIIDERERRAKIVSAGLICGLGMYFYLASLATPIIGLLIIFFRLNSDPQKFLKAVGFFLLGFFVASGPYFVFSFTNYNLIFGRSSIYYFWLENSHFFSILKNQLIRFLKGFYPGPMDGSGLHYTNSLPGFPNIITLLLFWLGLLGNIVKKRKQWGVLESIVVLSLTSLFGGILSESPPAAQRLIHLFPFMALFTVLGAKYLSAVLKKGLPLKIRPKRSPFWLFVLIGLLGNVYSFITNNIDVYRKLPKTELAFSRFYKKKGFNLPLAIHIPEHKKDQIFYYSNGLISPVKIENFKISHYSKFLYLTDMVGVNEIKDFPGFVSEDLAWDNNENFKLFYVFNKQLER